MIFMSQTIYDTLPSEVTVSDSFEKSSAAPLQIKLSLSLLSSWQCSDDKEAGHAYTGSRIWKQKTNTAKQNFL